MTDFIAILEFFLDDERLTSMQKDVKYSILSSRPSAQGTMPPLERAKIFCMFFGRSDVTFVSSSRT